MQKTSRENLIKSYNELMELLSYDYEVEIVGDSLVALNKTSNKKFELCKMMKGSKNFSVVPEVRGCEIIEYICNAFLAESADGSSKNQERISFKKYFFNFLKNVGHKNRYVFLK